MNWLKFAGIAAGVAACFIAGYEASTVVAERDIAKMREEYALKARSLEAEYREKEALSKQAVADAWAQRDAAYARMRDLSADANRVRLEADAVKRKLSRASDATCKRERQQVARCAELLARGGGLLERGVELSQSIAIDKDAIVRIVQ